ncbi:MAG: cold shock domain-containing protein [Candidatus Marinimicrobia bacterium]|jgi:CspA family cold shock protein|nr:cold shock domain-containing protein [Candidatus Neomarinimicrobiota bacterium]|tara:strand:+ start:6944 stop:7147 length:204 start_codon:yes stop_codon:yes gene_type:complete
MKKGIVKEYDSLKGFGFITGEDNEDYFVHVSGLREYLKGKGLRPGQRVSFDVDFGMKGDKAINVRTD